MDAGQNRLVKGGMSAPWWPENLCQGGDPEAEIRDHRGGVPPVIGIAEDTPATPGA